MRNWFWRELDRAFLVIPFGWGRALVFNFGPWSHAVSWDWRIGCACANGKPCERCDNGVIRCTRTLARIRSYDPDLRKRDRLAWGVEIARRNSVESVR